MGEHVAGVDMLGQADIIEMKGKLREFEKENKTQAKTIESQEQEIKRLRGVAGKSYGVGAVWFTAIAAFVVGIGLTVAYFLLT